MVKRWRFVFSLLLFLGVSFTVINLLAMQQSSDSNSVYESIYSKNLNLTQSAQCTRCQSNVPCEYKNEVDVRIIVLAFNRQKSLEKCLNKISEMQLDGLDVAIEIWLDITKEKTFHLQTYRYARRQADLKDNLCVHLQTEHAQASKQWLYSWRPKSPTTKEIALIVEDDIDLSPYAIRWLRAVNDKYKTDSSVFGYTLQMENVEAQITNADVPIKAPETDTTFKFTIFGTWGFSPKASFWIRFQDWLKQTLEADPDYNPVVEGYRSSNWYKHFITKHTEDTMAHEMYLIHYVAGNREKLYCVYSNLKQYTHNNNTQLSSHRFEDGLHFKDKAKSEDESAKKLLNYWDASFVNFPAKTLQYDAFGNKVPNWL